MGPAAGALLWALLLRLGAPAAGAQDHTDSSTLRPSSRGPARTFRTALSRRTSLSHRVTAEDEDDLMVDADRQASPAAAELLASTVTGLVRTLPGEDESLEEGGVVISANARKDNLKTEAEKSTASTPGGPSSRFPANVQEPEIRLTSDLRTTSSSTSGSSAAVDEPFSENTEGTESTLTTLNQWTTHGSSPSPWRTHSPSSMPAPEDLQLMLLPWGPWHCHCKSGTMSRSRAGKLHGLSGRLRVGALNQLRTEHKPCTYAQCLCDRLREECPLDNSDCSGASCTSPPTTKSTAAPSTRTLSTACPDSALEFWKRVRAGLEDIWNSLSSVFTQMQPIDRNRK
ncbi:protein MENT [Sorex araneus]|uniref:protein MENT n=1 Tax=Sorex araneus TaxID=42254 RepID=UPI00033151A8|nr:protein MENT [Sorex araneus]